MMTLDDVPEMLAAWRKGELQLDDVYYLCLNLFVVNAVEGVLATLPQELRGQFESKLAAEFDNDIPAEQYMFLESGRGDNPDKVSIINEVRAYVARVAARERERAGGDAATSHRFDGVSAITYAIGSEFAPDDPFGREVVELTAGGRLSYSRRFHGNASAKVRSYAPGRFAALLADLERTSFPTPPQRAFRPGPGPATISIAPSGASVSIDTNVAEDIDGYRELVETFQDLQRRLRKDDPSLAEDWGVAPVDSAE
jgi:hypothetical protein